MTSLAILGIDVSKATLNLALLGEGKRIEKKVVSNDGVGFVQLSEWLTKQGVEQVHACLEATNTYGQGVACYLYQQGHRVSVVNPLRIQGFAQGELVRTKTDSRDATTIARFCAAMNPLEWKPLEPATEELQQMSRRVEALQQMIVQEKNRLETSAEVLRAEIEAHIKFLETQMEKLREKIQTHVNSHDSLREALNLLTTIKGISTLSGTQILAEIGNWKEFGSARQLAAYAGLTPQAKESGTSVHGKTRLCKIGNAHLRRALYFPALTVLRWSEPMKAWGEALRGRGKTKMQVVGAVMHKLVRIIFGVLKSGQPFNPELLVAKD